MFHKCSTTAVGYDDNQRLVPVQPASVEHDDEHDQETEILRALFLRCLGDDPRPSPGAIGRRLLLLAYVCNFPIPGCATDFELSCALGVTPGRASQLLKSLRMEIKLANVQAE